jgi:hypothetical protein
MWKLVLTFKNYDPRRTPLLYIFKGRGGITSDWSLPNNYRKCMSLDAEEFKAQL